MAGSTSRWMECLSEELRARPLNTIAIPGSHDSFTSSMDPEGEIAPDVTPQKSILSELGPVFSKPQMIYAWALTQDRSMEDQLEFGIRYLDLRVVARDGDLFLCHSLYAQSLESGLAEVKKFILEHEKEVVLLHFQHLYEMTEKHHDQLADLLNDKFGTLLCPKQEMNDLSLNLLCSKGHRVLAIYDHPNPKERHSHLWPNCDLVTPWPNKSYVKELFDFLEDNGHRVHDMNTFHVTQVVLTPSHDYILNNPSGSTRKMSQDVGEGLQNWLSQKKNGLDIVNICIADFVNEKFVKTVLKLNYDQIAMKIQ